MNIRYVERIADLAPLLHLKVATDERGHEFENVLKPGEAPPDLICYQGDTGREAMTVILGPNPMAVAEKALALKNALQAGGKLPE